MRHPLVYSSILKMIGYSSTAASKKLFISQPALSQVIKNVEDELGALLFEKDGNRLKLTYAGELYVEYGQQMLDIDRNLHMRIADMRN